MTALSRRLLAKEWSVRLEANEELCNIFSQAPPSAPEFAKYGKHCFWFVFLLLALACLIYLMNVWACVTYFR